jgi:hypothetical protein
VVEGSAVHPHGESAYDQPSFATADDVAERRVKVDVAVSLYVEREVRYRLRPLLQVISVRHRQ